MTKKEIREYVEKVYRGLQLPPEKVGEGMKAFVGKLREVQEGRLNGTIHK